MPERISHYVLQERLGAGGMGTVYRAIDDRTGQTVAIKILHPHLAANQDELRRFEREARLATTIDSRSVVDVLDAGREGDSAFLVMEFIDGQTLEQLINSRGKLPLPQAIYISSSIARALVAAQARGVVHRDISP